MDAVNILAKIKDDWFEGLTAAKWQIRGETVDKLIELCNVPRLEQGDYGEVAKALKKVLQLPFLVVLTKLPFSVLETRML